MQWIRRCKQEELTLIDSFNGHDELAERQNLLRQFQKKQMESIPKMPVNYISSKKQIEEESKAPSQQSLK